MKRLTDLELDMLEHRMATSAGVVSRSECQQMINEIREHRGNTAPESTVIPWDGVLEYP